MITKDDIDLGVIVTISIWIGITWLLHGQGKKHIPPDDSATAGVCLIGACVCLILATLMGELT